MKAQVQLDLQIQQSFPDLDSVYYCNHHENNNEVLILTQTTVFPKA